VSSTNWSGYAVSSLSQFTAVQGTWTQPAVTCSSHSAQYSSFWVGIDGYTSSSVEQLGTDSDCTGRGRASYYAWYEMYPAGSFQIPNPVKVGDTLSASVAASGGMFTLTIASSEGWTFQKTFGGSGLAQSSAEWIAESPSLCSGNRCTITQLADFGTVNFTKSEATAGGTAQPISSFTASGGPHEIVGVTNGGTVRAQPSALSTSSTGSSFGITWHHD
jgi:hypothetical protein